MLDNITKYTKRESETPVGHHVFGTSYDVIRLSKDDADIFDHLMAPILYLLKRA